MSHFKEQVRNELTEILKGILPINAYEVANIKNAKHKVAPLYLVDREVFKEVLYLEQVVRAYIGNSSKRVHKNTFREFAKIIDITPAYRYSIGSKHHYKNISDRDKILRELPAIIRIHQNKEKKRLREWSKKYEWDSQYFAKVYRDLEKTLQEEEEQIKEIEKNIEEYNVVITSYESYEIYPNIYYTTIDNKKKQSLLRQTAPNIFFLRRG